MEVQQLLTDYTQTYQQLYRRNPSEVRYLGEGWVLVNGARMTMNELTHLTDQLREEVEKSQSSKRSVVMRLLKWFSAPQASD